MPPSYSFSFFRFRQFSSFLDIQRKRVEARMTLKASLFFFFFWFFLVVLTCSSSSFFFFFLHRNINTKNYWKGKKRLCVRLRSADKHRLRKSSDRKAQISPVSRTNVFLMCAFRSEDFLRWCLSTEPNLTHNLFFYFQLFLVLIWFIFSMRRRMVQPETWSFVSVLRSPVTQFDRGKTIAKSANFTKKGNCFVECNVFGNEKVWIQRQTMQIFGKEKCKTLRQFQRFGKEKCKTLCQCPRY